MGCFVSKPAAESRDSEAARPEAKVAANQGSHRAESKDVHLSDRSDDDLGANDEEGFVAWSEMEAAEEQDYLVDEEKDSKIDLALERMYSDRHRKQERAYNDPSFWHRIMTSIEPEPDGFHLTAPFTLRKAHLLYRYLRTGNAQPLPRKFIYEVLIAACKQLEAQSKEHGALQQVPIPAHSRASASLCLCACAICAICTSAAAAPLRLCTRAPARLRRCRPRRTSRSVSTCAATRTASCRTCCGSSSCTTSRRRATRSSSTETWPTEAPTRGGTSDERARRGPTECLHSAYKVHAEGLQSAHRVPTECLQSASCPTECPLPCVVPAWERRPTPHAPRPWAWPGAGPAPASWL